MHNIELEVGQKVLDNFEGKTKTGSRVEYFIIKEEGARWPYLFLHNGYLARAFKGKTLEDLSKKIKKAYENRTNAGMHWDSYLTAVDRISLLET